MLKYVYKKQLNNMYIFTNFTKNDSYYEFTTDKGDKQIFPLNAIIFIDDTDDYVSVKLTASRATAGLLKK